MYDATELADIAIACPEAREINNASLTVKLVGKNKCTISFVHGLDTVGVMPENHSLRPWPKAMVSSVKRITPN